MIDYRKLKKENIKYTFKCFKNKDDIKKIYKFCMRHKNNGNCNFILGCFYMYGYYVNEDEEKGLKHFKRAVNQGHIESCSKVSYHYYNKIFFEEKANEKNIKYMIKYCKKLLKKNSNDSRALYKLAQLYSEGNDNIITNNIFKKYYKPKLAKRICKKIYKIDMRNKRTYLLSMKNILRIYYYGIGTKKNLKKALKMYKKLNSITNMSKYINELKREFTLLNFDI